MKRSCLVLACLGLLAAACSKDPALCRPECQNAAGECGSCPDAAASPVADAAFEPPDAADQDGSLPPDAASPDAGAPGEDASAGDTGPGYTLQVLAQYTDALHDLLYVGGNVYAVDSMGNQVRAFSAATRDLVATIPVGNAPGSLSTDGRYVFVLDRTARELDLDVWLSVIDSTSNTVVRSSVCTTKTEGADPTNYPTTNFPWAATVLDGTLYADFPGNSTTAQANLLPVAIGSWAERTFWYAGSGPDELAGLGGRLFVINGRVITNPDDDAIGVYQADGTPVQTLETSGRLIDVVAASGRIWASRAPSGATYGEIVVVDPGTLQRRAIQVCVKPYQLAVSGTRLYVACEIGTATYPEVDVVDMDTETVVERIALDAFPSIVKPRGIAATPAGDVFLESEGMISVLVRR